MEFSTLNEKYVSYHSFQGLRLTAEEDIKRVSVTGGDVRLRGRSVF